MKRWCGNQSGGFTITEVLIVLAVSGIIFASAILLVTGRQQKVEFMTGSQDFVAALNAAAQNVSNGYSGIANSDNYTCSSSGPLSLAHNAGAIGTNTGCIFIGEVIQLPDPSSSDSYAITPLLGYQYKNGNPALGFSQSPSDSGVLPTSQTSSSKIGGGITVGCVLYSTTARPAPSSVAPCSTGIGGYIKTSALTFLTTYQGTTIGQGGASSRVNLVVPVSDMPTTGAGSALDGTIYTDSTKSVSSQYLLGGVYICLQSGTTDAHALVSIGGAASQFTAQLTVGNGGCS